MNTNLAVTHRGIPTTYGSTNFRSRIEARWAAFFDLVGWLWEYEPVDLDGYIPDFIVQTGRLVSPILVEVKSCLNKDELDAHVAKIYKSGWKGSALVVGANPNVARYVGWSAPYVQRQGPVFRLQDAFTINTFEVWRREIAHYLKPFHDIECGAVTVVSDIQWSLCNRSACQKVGFYTGDKQSEIYGLSTCDHDSWGTEDYENVDVTMQWRKAGNEVQWRPV